MGAYFGAGKWRYRKTIRLPDGSPLRISGTPSINTQEEAEIAEVEHIDRARFQDQETGDLSPKAEAGAYLVKASDRKGFTTNQMGAISEASVVSHLLRAGYSVSHAFGSLRYDLLIEKGGEIKRVQVKTASLINGWLRFNNYSIVHRTLDGPAKHRKYGVDEVDCFAVYSPDLDRTYLVPNSDDVPASLHSTASPEDAQKRRQPGRRRRSKTEHSAVAQGIEQPIPNGQAGSSKLPGATEEVADSSAASSPEAAAQDSCARH
jgi:hypothetical protein